MKWSHPLNLPHLCMAPSDTTDLATRLGPPVHGGRVLGCVSQYMQTRYGLSPQCAVVAFTGDNPATFAAMRLAPGVPEIWTVVYAANQIGTD